MRTEAREQFKGFQKNSLSTIMKMSHDEGAKGLIMKRAVEVSDRWHRRRSRVLEHLGSESFLST